MSKIFFSLIYLFTFQVLAIENTGAVSAATGGAGVGVLETVDGTYLNPASIALFDVKSFAVSYSKFHTNFHITDNGRDALFPAAFIYSRTDENNMQTLGYHLALATAWAQNFSTGMDLQFREIKIVGIDDQFRQTVISPAVFYRFSNVLSMGLIWKNKALTNTDLPDIIDQNSTVALGMGYVYEKFAKFRADVETAENEMTDKLNYKFGLETYLNDWIITRIGYQNDNVHSLNFFTAGVGFEGPQFGFQYAYQSEARNNRDPLHTIDLNIPF
jgi:hypothetical protein